VRLQLAKTCNNLPQEECKKRKKCRNQALLKEVMEKTFSRRRQWKLEKAPLASGVLQKYPCLSSTKMVICEVYTFRVYGLTDFVT